MVVFSFHIKSGVFGWVNLTLPVFIESVNFCSSLSIVILIWNAIENRRFIIFMIAWNGLSFTSQTFSKYVTATIAPYLYLEYLAVFFWMYDINLSADIEVQL